MTQEEYDRLNKAHKIQSDIRLLHDAISVLKKQPVAFHYYTNESEIVRMALVHFIKDEDYVELLSEKLEALEKEFNKI